MDKKLYAKRRDSFAQETSGYWRDHLSLEDHCFERWHPKASAIERMMLLAFKAYQTTYNGCFLVAGNASVDEAARFSEWNNLDPVVFFQQTINSTKYTADFWLMTPHSKKSVIVECDGHDFHERTPKQAEHDRKRDRKLIELGYVVLRFTGREIWRDPMKCAQDAINQFQTSNAEMVA
jgi:very-short-patch-repair endonuclease